MPTLLWGFTALPKHTWELQYCGGVQSFDRNVDAAATCVFGSNITALAISEDLQARASGHVSMPHAACMRHKVKLH